MLRNVIPVLAAMATAVVLVGSPRSAWAVMFPDKALEAAVRYQILEKRDKTDELSEDDLKKVFILEARGKGIKDLTGLEKCVNLQSITLSKNEITDVTALKGLKNVQLLDLAGNKITDVAPLSELTALQYLELSDNQVTDLKPLAGLTKMASLYLSGNKVTDLAPLVELKKLASLHLDKNQITDLKPIEGITGLYLLKLSDNQITDVTPLQNMRNIKMLFLERNKLEDLTPLVKACQEDAEKTRSFAPFLRLYVKDNPLSEAAKNEQLAKLKELGVKIDPENK